MQRRKHGCPWTQIACIRAGDDERVPLARTLLVLDVRDVLPPLECFKDALCSQVPSPALPISPPVAFADGNSSGLVGTSSGCGSYGLSLALPSHLRWGFTEGTSYLLVGALGYV